MMMSHASHLPVHVERLSLHKCLLSTAQDDGDHGIDVADVHVGVLIDIRTAFGVIHTTQDDIDKLVDV